MTNPSDRLAKRVRTEGFLWGAETADISRCRRIPYGRAMENTIETIV